MSLSNNARLIESLLFLENEPLSVEKIASMTGIEEDVILASLSELSEEFYSGSHGLSLVENSGTWSFVPCSNLTEKLRLCYGRKVDRRLSRSAIETLTIIAYSQPVTRSEVTKIRGVVSDTIIRHLKEMDYIRVVDNKRDAPGRPCLYGTTQKFLYTFNLNSISDLPTLSEIDRQRFEREKPEDTDEL